MSTVILTATTSAAQSEDFTITDVAKGVVSHAHLTAPGLAGAETATVQKKNADDSYSDYYINGALQQVTATNTGVVVEAAGIYRMNKSATVASVGVEISTPDKP